MCLTAAGLAKVCPNLIALDLSENEIKGLSNIIELGVLQNLQRLDFSKNPICSAYNRIQIIQLLFYPEKYGKYDPVQVLTATYSHVPNYQYSKKEYVIILLLLCLIDGGGVFLGIVEKERTDSGEKHGGAAKS